MVRKNHFKSSPIADQECDFVAFSLLTSQGPSGSYVRPDPHGMASHCEGASVGCSSQFSSNSSQMGRAPQ